MANDKAPKTNADGTPKKKREQNTTKGKWMLPDGKTEWKSLKESGKIAQRAVDSVYGPDKTPIRYTEVKLHGVSNPTEALDLLKLQKAKAVAAIQHGAKILARQAAAGDNALAKKIAERKGTTFEEELKKLQS